MRVIKDTPFEFGYLVSQVRPPRFSLTVVVKATFDIVHDGVCTISGEQRPVSGESYYDDDFAQSLRYDSDLAVLKPNGEFYLAGTCHAPGGRPTGTTAVSLAVGTSTVSLAVFGDRVWRGALPTEPTPFTSMPLRYERSFGGLGCRANPVGVGAVDVKDVKGAKNAPRALPNLENPRALIAHPTDRPEPAGLFPLPPTWRPRLALAGTYDAKWLASRWPQLPENFDYAYFNAAPRDQQIRGYFNGDEEIVATNLHPERARLRTRLPGLRARVFAESGGDLREVVMHMDTVVVDTDAGQVLCAWRGMTPVATDKLADTPYTFAMHEPTATPSTLEQCRARFAHRLALADRPTATGETDAPPPQDDDAFDESEREVKLHMAQARLMALTLDWGVNQPPPAAAPPQGSDDVTVVLPTQNPGPAPGPDVMPQSLDETWLFDDDVAANIVVAHTAPLASSDETVILDDLTPEKVSGVDKSRAVPTVSETIAHASADDTVLFDEVDRAQTLPPPPDSATGDQPAKVSEVLAQLLASGASLPEGISAVAQMDAPAAPETPAETVSERLRALRQRVLSAHAVATSLAGEDLAGVDLSRDELAGIDLTGAILTGAVLRGTNLEGAKLGEAVLTNANLQGARLRGALLSRSDFTGAIASRACFEGATLTHAALAGANFAHADFRSATLVGVDLAGADLTAADLDRGILDGANLSKSTLVNARFSQAHMVGCALEAVSARGARFDKADLSKANLSEHADFRGASFVEATATQANFANARLNGADLSHGNFERADFSEAVLIEAKMSGCNLKSATFREAQLAGAELLKCDAMDAGFEGADLRRADLRGSNLFGADFVRTNTTDARLELANLKRTRLG